jgi:hypothetical protein
MTEEMLLTLMIKVDPMNRRIPPGLHKIANYLESVAAENAQHLFSEKIERLNSALLTLARRVEGLKQECGMDPESRQAVRNTTYMNIALAARGAIEP